MDLFLYTLEHVANFLVASVPFVLVILLLKYSNLPPKHIGICISLNLLVSVFFWLKLRDIYVTLYQIVPYISSFVWIWAEGLLRKKREKKHDDDATSNSCS